MGQNQEDGGNGGSALKARDVFDSAFRIGPVELQCAAPTLMLRDSFASPSLIFLQRGLD